MKQLAIIGLGLVATGCVTLTARVRGGPTVSTTGNAGWEVGLAAGIGCTGSRSTSIRSTPMISVGDRGVMWGTTIEVGASEERYGWYGGIAAELATTEGQSARRAYAAVTRPISFERNEPDSEKGLNLHQRKALSIGLEAHAGLAFSDPESVRGRFALLPVLDYTLTSAD